MTAEEMRSRGRLRLVCPGMLLLALAVLLLLVATARLRGALASAIVRPEKPAYVADIFGGNTVGQSFRASHDGLCRVDILLRPVLDECQVDFRLWAEGHEEGTLSGCFPCPQDESVWYTVRFPRIPASEGVEFRWEVGLADPASGAVVSLEAAADDIRPDGALYVNGQATASDALFMPSYCNAKVAGSLIAEWLEQNHHAFIEWLEQNRHAFIEWLDQDHDILSTDRLLVLVVVMALTLVTLLALPSREQPVRVHFRLPALLPQERFAKIRPLPLVTAVGALGLASAVLLMIMQLRMCTPAATGQTEGPWVAYDFIANLSAPETVLDTPEDWYVSPGWLELGPDRRPVLRMHPPSHVYYTLEVPPDARLHAAAALDPEVWQPDRGDGVLFIVRTIVDGVEETVYYREIDPKNNPEDRRWHDFDVDLSPYSGQTITLLFITYPLEGNDWDWAGWGMPVILVPNAP